MATQPPGAHGPDVNGWHPVKDWGALAASGATIFGAKATEGNRTTDKTFARHRDGVRDWPFALAVYYHFARAGNPREQARRFCDVVGTMEANERMCVDFEGKEAKDLVCGPDAAANLRWLGEFLDVLIDVAPGRRPLIYTSGRVWSLIGDPAWEYGAAVDLWAPRYSDGVKQPKLPSPWRARGWTIWQWTDGTILPNAYPGVGPCDSNVFAGDEAALRRYATGAAEPSAAVVEEVEDDDTDRRPLDDFLDRELDRAIARGAEDPEST